MIWGSFRNGNAYKIINFIKMNNCNKVLVTFQNDAFRLWYVVLKVCAIPI